MADFISNQEELERLSKEAQQAQLEKSAATDRLKQGMSIGAILGLPRSANKAEIMAGVQPNNAGRQAVQQAWERPAALEAQSAEQRYKDILDRYKQGQTGVLKSRELEQEKGKLSESERHNKAMEFAALSKQGEKAGKGSVGEQALDRKFANSYNDYVNEGGAVTIDTNLKKMEGVLDKLEKGEVKTGDFWSKVAPTEGKAGAIANPSLIAVKEQLESAIQNTLRPILGGQFAMIEGQQIMSRAFNPSLPTKVNVQKIRAEMDNLKKRAAAMNEAVAHWEANEGTLKGYKGGNTLKNVTSEINTAGNAPKPKNYNVNIIPSANAASKPDFTKMSDEELQAYIGGK